MSTVLLRRVATRVTVCAATLLTASLASGQDANDDLARAFAEGKFNVAFRYRFENVDEEPFTEEANASTLRTRLTYTTANWRGLGALIEMDDLRSVGDDNYNSTRNGETQRPIVADPEATDLNQMALKYTGLENAEIVVGRQRILRGNERFVGPVGWRQNEQTMDSASIGYKFGDRLQAWYGYVSQVNRVFGPDDGAPPADLTGNTHLADVSYAFGAAAKLTAYGYFLDFEEAPALSSQTLGARLAGDIALGSEWALPYALEYATQQDYGDNTADYDTEYYLAEAGVRWQKLTARLSYEVLGADDTGAFQTPLATLHAFQGWADKFLATPASGIRDEYLRFAYKPAMTGPFEAIDFAAVYHVFDADFGPASYGDEFDLQVSARVSRVTLILKYATYTAESLPYTDTDKIWFSMDYAL
jgi:hypothetical protein